MKNRKVKVLTIAGGLLSTIMLAAVVNVSVLPQKAHAHCWSTGNPGSLVGKANPAGVWGQEFVQYESTCDGDGVYKGRVSDVETDGRYVQVRLATRADMKNEFIHVYTGLRRNYTMYGSWHMRICKSGTPIGVDLKDDRCSKKVFART